MHTHTLHEHVHRHFLSIPQLNRCTHEHIFVWHGPEALGPVSFESALRGLTWAATCLGRAGSDQTERRPPLQHICSSPLSFLPSPHTSALCSFGGTHTATHIYSCPRSKPYAQGRKTCSRVGWFCVLNLLVVEAPPEGLCPTTCPQAAWVHIL